jgi:hypothetical protein
MITSMPVCPARSLGVVAILAVWAACFACSPARADKPQAASAKQAEQALPKSIDTEDGFAEMRTSLRNLKQLSIAMHDWANGHHVTPRKTDNLADPKSA